ncbi:hypothetical protein SPWS13_2637 [Shewanella putrefaciens]|nr:hypothetical protein SPWS13_2637 [Shewanella putrefaciens]
MNSQSKSTHKALGLLLVAFIAPVVIAKLVLSLNLYHGGATNFGELINPATSYTSLGVTNPKPKEWQLLYLLPSNAMIIAVNACIFYAKVIPHSGQIKQG